MSQSMGVRPSELLDLDDRLAAFSFDRAVYTFGTALESELENVEGKTKKDTIKKRTRILEKWIPETKAAGRQRFADPGKRDLEL